MKPGPLEILLYVVGVTLLISGLVVRSGHLASPRLGFTLLGTGFLVGSIGRLLSWRRARRRRREQLQAQFAHLRKP